MSLRNFVALAFAVSIFVSPAASQDKNPGPGNDSLVIRFEAEPPNINLLTHQDAYGARILGYLYDGLLDLNKYDMKLYPKLAKEMPVISDDKLTWTFKLREGVKWHDGTEFCADDVKASHDLMMDPKVDCQRTRSYYEDLEKVTVVDKYTVQFKIKKKYWYAKYTLGTDFPIMPRSQIQGVKGEDFNNHKMGREPVGNGPWKFESWDPGNKIVLTRNEDYYGTKPNIKKIVFRFIKDDVAALELCKRGELDLNGLRADQWEKQVKDNKEILKDYNVLSYFRNVWSYIGWNASKPLFKDKRVRQALTYALNREEIIKTVFVGHARQVTGPFYPECPQNDASLKPYAFDQEKAKELLDAAGWSDTNNDGILDKDGKKLEFELLLTTNNPAAEKIATLYKKWLEEIGIVMNIRQLEWGGFLEKLNNDDFDATLLAWNSEIAEDDPYQIWHSSQIAERGSNRVHFINKRADELIEKAREEFDENKRNEMYHELHKILYEEQPYTFGFNTKAFVLVHKRFENAKQGQLGIYPRAGDDWWVAKDREKYGK